MIDLEKMAEAHKRLFPKATAESQLWKLEEEIAEFYEAHTTIDTRAELADICIVCAGLYRWFPKTAQELVYRFGAYFPFTNMEVEAEVARKWQINLKRKWAWNGKTYHHVGDDECK